MVSTTLVISLMFFPQRVAPSRLNSRRHVMKAPKQTRSLSSPYKPVSYIWETEQYHFLLLSSRQMAGNVFFPYERREVRRRHAVDYYIISEISYPAFCH